MISLYNVTPVAKHNIDNKFANKTGAMQSNPIFSSKSKNSQKFAFNNFAWNENTDTVDFSNDFITKKHCQRLKNIGDEYAYDEQNTKAIYYYKEAIKIKPDYTVSYYNLAKIYNKTGDFNKAINTYKELLAVKPDEVEAQTLIGQYFKEKGDYKIAEQAYKKAVEIDPKYDFALRSLKEINNLTLAQHNPEKAELIKQQTAKNNLKNSLMLINLHAPSDLIKGLKNINIIFDETDSLSGHQNIAQYENHNNKIVITNDYIWASPEIIAAYIMHEAVHAKDKDGISSIKEEQNAYQISIEFWIAHNNGIKDPELDYAADLYKENPQKLKQKVAYIYKSRDKSIPDYSPNHMPTEDIDILTNLKLYLLKFKNKFNQASHIN
ncbi:MAG: tetratricopeptide repeat protein [Candidatus Aenigmarchaeota archaeon]|nr:tetratricopeptide repeat protein [Candidatus Aenigmarchaeota archaeon]